MKFLTILKAVASVFSIGERLYVFADPCDCGSASVDIYEFDDGAYCVFCEDCKLRGSKQSTKRLAKRAWNNIIRMDD